MGKGAATLCLLGGALIAALGFGWVPNDVLRSTAPRELVAAGGLVLAAVGLLSLGRDHRGSEMLTSLVLLAIAAGTGWFTFVAPEGTLHRYLPFVPATVNESLGRLLFGLGAAICIGMAFWGFRRILR